MKHVWVVVLEDGSAFDFELNLADNFFIMQHLRQEPPPRWALRENFPHCDFCEFEECLAASNICKILEVFNDVSSISRMNLTIIKSDGETSTRQLLAGEGLRLIFMAALIFSRCPAFSKLSWAWEYYADYLKPENVFYTIVSAKLTRVAVNGSGHVSLDSVMDEVHRDLQRAARVLSQLHDCMHEHARNDGNLNAFVSLINLSQLLDARGEGYLDRLRRNFCSRGHDTAPAGSTCRGRTGSN